MIYHPANAVCLPRRSARVGFLLLAILTLSIALGILVIDSFFATVIRAQQENATDAAALAAAEVFADEALLYGDPSIFDTKNCKFGEQHKEPTSPTNQSLCCQAAHSAIQFGHKNLVGGKRFELESGDIFFDIVDVPKRETLGSLPADQASAAPYGAPLTLAQKRSLNAVQIVGKCASSSSVNLLRYPIDGKACFHMSTRSEAVLDGYIRGFYTDPEGTINIPLAPAALNAPSWHDQVEADVDPSFVKPADGPLPYGTFKVNIGASASDPDSHKPSAFAPIVLIGTTSVAQALSQFDPKNTGVTPRQYGVYLAANNKKPFELDPKTLSVTLPATPVVAPADLAQLEANLTNLKDRRLVWPLYSTYDDSTGQGRAIIVGFVAARIIDVKKDTYSVMVDHDGKGKGKHKGPCGSRPRGKAEGHDNGKSDDDSNGNQNDNGNDDSRDLPKGHGKGNSCVEFSVLQVTLRPTLLATSTGMVFVKDWPAGPQHQFRFPNAYVKRIRLVK